MSTCGCALFKIVAERKRLHQKVMGRGRGWSEVEDRCVAKAWAITTVDCVKGTDQRVNQFWREVAQKYGELLKDAGSLLDGMVLTFQFFFSLYNHKPFLYVY